MNRYPTHEAKSLLMLPARAVRVERTVYGVCAKLSKSDSKCASGADHNLGTGGTL